MSESELERIAKLRKMGFAPDTTGITTSNQLPGQETPMIQRKSRDEMVLEEARYLAAMTATRSTLYGGETPSGFADGAGKDFSGATPSLQGGQRTNQRGHTNVVHGTPALQRPGTGVVGQTPLRDDLQINDPDAVAEFMRPSDSAGSNQQLDHRRPLTSGIKSRFASLPKPKNEFKVQIPNIDELDELEDDDAMEFDASVIVARLLKSKKTKLSAENAFVSVKKWSDMKWRSEDRKFTNVETSCPNRTFQRGIPQSLWKREKT